MPEYVLSDILYEFLVDLIKDADDVIRNAKSIRSGYPRAMNIANYIRQISRGAKLDRTLSQFQTIYPFYSSLYEVYIRKFFANLLVSSTEDIIMVTDLEMEAPDTVSYAIDVSAYDSMFLSSAAFFKEFIRRFTARDLNEMTRNIVDGRKPLSAPIMSLVRVVSVVAVYDAINDTLENGVYVYRIRAAPKKAETAAEIGGSVPAVADPGFMVYPPMTTGPGSESDLEDSDSDSDSEPKEPTTVVVNVSGPAAASESVVPDFTPGPESAEAGAGAGTAGDIRDQSTTAGALDGGYIGGDAVSVSDVVGGYRGMSALSATAGTLMDFYGAHMDS